MGRSKLNIIPCVLREEEEKERERETYRDNSEPYKKEK